ncbi:MAG: Flp pilus assembly complex ATPase component TadA [Deltaproteobacteria bacterium]|nr:Flp pilus assembly complex ATPase component TadA [Deltaproteobacteria bacterium]
MDENITENQTIPKIGELLVKEGIVKEKDVEKALEIQKKEIEEASQPLGTLLVKNGLISKDQLRSLLDHPYLRKRIGKLAIQKGLVDEKQMEECLKNKKPDEMIGNALIREGFATANDVKGLLIQQVGGTKLGQLALKSGIIREEDLNNILNRKRYQRTLGEILCDLNIITPIDLNRILQKYNKHQRLGDILLKQEIINNQQLKETLYEQKHRAEYLGKILIEKNFITLEQLYAALSKQYNIAFRKLDGFNLSQSQINTLSSFIGKNYAAKNRILPLSSKKNRLTLAVSDVDSLQIVPDLSSMYSLYSIDCVLITHEKFKAIFETLYGEALIDTETVEEVKQVEDVEDIEDLVIDLEKTDTKKSRSDMYGISDMQVQELVNHIIKYGLMKNASDIHIEQDRSDVKVRYRIDGVLQTFTEPWLDTKLRDSIGEIISRIKIISNLDIAEKRMPQDGAFRINYSDKTKFNKVPVDFRVAVCPAIVGENITIRILDPRKANKGIDNLGLSKHILKPLKELLKSPAGMVLLTGPTGSGKTSTLYGALQFIYDPGLKIITAEDPIEYSIPGIMQTQVNTKINLTFSRLLRSFLRLDPDIILIGEMRDNETANIGFDAVQTGHLLLSTLHTTDSTNVISRLHGLNIERNQIASGLMGVLAQRLIRKICPSCSSEYVPTKKEWGLLFKDYPADLVFYKAEGCELCDYTGYGGRTLISEFFVINKEIALAIIRGTKENEIRRMAIEDGMKTMVDDCILKLNQTTLSEIIRVMPHEMIKEFKSRDFKPSPARTLKRVTSKSL